MFWQHHGGQHQQLVCNQHIPFLLFTNIFILASASTEWFGDSRAHMNPPQSPPFNDVIYDDYECPDGLESEVIPDYAYFGQMVENMDVSRYAKCLDNCIKHSKCVAVNFFAPMIFQENGFCELLSETQLDNPKLMKPFKRAAYFENIQCRKENSIINNDYNENTFEKPRTDAKLLKKLPEQVDQYSFLHRQ